MFSSTPFLFAFLPASLLLYFFTAKLSKRRTVFTNLLLCLLSAALYIAISLTSGGFSPVIFLLVAWNYLCSLLARITKRRAFLTVGIVVDVVVLVWFKYASLLASALHITLPLPTAMPLGLSFIIFHCISYLADVSLTRRQNELCEFTDCACYLLFFPKLFQGPIVRWKDFSGSLSARRVTFDSFESGLERFLIGLGKKVLLADEFANMLSHFPNVGYMDAPTAWLGMILFAMQMYFDFSGYSDMAIGLARFFGFSFAENFDHPYTSTSITEFWRRWHISLGAWFREYVYIPLGGNRRGNVYIHLLIVFILTGLWHGNALVYLLWGLWHALFILFERTPLYRKLREKVPGWKYFGWLYTTLAVFFGWLCFRYENLSTLLTFLRSMFGTTVGELSFTWQYFYNTKALCYLAAAIVGIFLFSRPGLIERFKRIQDRPAAQIVKYVLLLAIAAACYIGLSYNSYTPFLYFQY